jgi:HlyD family secretion protein
MKKAKLWFWLLFAVIIIGAVFWWWRSSRNQDPSYSTVIAETGPLVQTVSETGTLKPIKEVSLNFLSSGRIKAINVKIGDKVSAGFLMAVLDDSSLQARKLELEAGLKIAEASLSKILVGASTGVIAVSRSTVTQAQASATSAKTDLEKTKRSVAEATRQAEKSLADLESSSASTPTPLEQSVSAAQTALDNAKKTGQKNEDNTRSSSLMILSDKILGAQIALDNINTILEDDDAKSVLSVRNSSLLSKTKEARLAALNLLGVAEDAALVAKTTGTEDAIDRAGDKVRDLLAQTDNALDYTYAMLEATITSVDFPQSSLDSYKTLVSSQSTQINAASTAVESSVQAFHNAILNNYTNQAAAEEALRQAQTNLSNAIIAAANAVNSAKLNGEQQIASVQARLDSANQSIAVAQAQLDNTMAPARSQDVALAQAQVSQAQAGLAGIKQQLDEMILLAPLDGVITAVNYEVGEQFGVGGKAMINILVNNSFNIEVDIAESNISKIKAGDPVEITLDAFPDDFILQGVVSFIEPAQTLIQDVVYYKVKIDFRDLASTMAQIASRNLSLKAGMTANVIVTTDQRAAVLQVPARALIEKDGGMIVRLLIDNVAQEVPVETGLRGDEGMIEIVSGLKPGDTVITFTKTNGAAAN